jgi:hypothetical protein
MGSASANPRIQIPMLHAGRDIKLKTKASKRRYGTDYSFMKRHLSCAEVGRQSPYGNGELNILLSCKSIYHEARLIPLEASLFTFTNPRTFETFIRYLQPQQRAALSEIMLYEAHQLRRWRTQLSKDIVPMLQGMRELTLSVDICAVELVEGDSDMLSKASRQEIFSGAEGLSKCDMVSVKANIVNTTKETMSRVRSPGHSPTPEELVMWEEEIRERFLRSVDET